MAKAAQKSSLWTMLFRLASLPVISLLTIYNLRRLLFLFAALFPSNFSKEAPSDEKHLNDPDILILVPCRDEEAALPELCACLSHLDYPTEALQVALIDDGSQDHTRRVMETWAAQRPGWHVLSLPVNRGKAHALNQALKQISFGDLVFVYDADHRPEANALRRFVKYFDDPRVSGVSGRTLPINPEASPSAYYSTVESYVHQMITMRAKDRLDLAPAMLGSNCGYRRSHLMECGGFRDGALLEDSDLTITFHKAGYKTRFAADAVACHQVPETISGYLNQHMRWGRGFNDVSKNHIFSLLRDREMWPSLRFELFLFSTGYLDRVALLGAGGLAGLSLLDKRRFKFPGWVLWFALISPILQIIALFIEQHVPVSMWKRLPWVPIFFSLDAYAALRSQADALLNRPKVWNKTERRPTVSPDNP